MSPRVLAALLLATSAGAQPHSDRRVPRAGKTERVLRVLRVLRAAPGVVVTPARAKRPVLDTVRVMPLAWPRAATVGSAREPWPIVLVPLLAGAVLWTVTRGPTPVDTILPGSIPPGVTVTTPEPAGLTYTLAYILIGGLWLALRKRDKR